MKLSSWTLTLAIVTGAACAPPQRSASELRAELAKERAAFAAELIARSRERGAATATRSPGLRAAIYEKRGQMDVREWPRDDERARLPARGQRVDPLRVLDRGTLGTDQIFPFGTQGTPSLSP